MRNLRLLGIDVCYDNNASDTELLVTATTEDRALLTRDRRLLMHAIVRHGYCPRSHLHEEQTLEVIERFDLAKAIVPFTRCVRCNGPLAHVEKDRVLISSNRSRAFITKIFTAAVNADGSTGPARTSKTRSADRADPKSGV